MNKIGSGKDFHNRVSGKNFTYPSFAPMFKAELWELEKWAKLFKDAGAKYVIPLPSTTMGFLCGRAAVRIQKIGMPWILGQKDIWQANYQKPLKIRV